MSLSGFSNRGRSSNRGRPGHSLTNPGSFASHLSVLGPNASQHSTSFEPINPSAIEDAPGGQAFSASMLQESQGSFEDTVSENPSQIPPMNNYAQAIADFGVADSTTRGYNSAICLFNQYQLSKSDPTMDEISGDALADDGVKLCFMALQSILPPQSLRADEMSPFP
jgi:hypothetical protein